MSKNQKILCRGLNYFKHLLISVSAITGCFSISDFASLICIPLGITSSTVELKLCAITDGNKKYKWKIKRRRNMIKYYC